MGSRLCLVVVVGATFVFVIVAQPSRLSADPFWESLNGPYGGSVYALAWDPVSDAIYAGTSYQHGYNQTGGSVFRSTDHGVHWTYVSADIYQQANPITTRVRALAVNSQGHVYAGMEGAGVFVSTNGGANWTAINTGLIATLRVRDIAFSPSDEPYAATESNGVYRFNGASWVATNAGLTNFATRCLAFGDDYALVGTASGGIFKRPLAGGNWTAVNNGLSTLAISSIHVSTDGSRLLACTGAGLFESLDGAASWHPLVGPFAGGLVNDVVEAANALLVGTSTGIYIGDPAGTQWSAATNGFSGAACLRLIEDGDGRAYAGSLDDGVFRSLDDGASWSDINNGLAGRTVTRLLVTSTGDIFAGTNAQGIFRSNVLGSAWTGPALPKRSIFALAESPRGDLFAGNYTIAAGGVPDGHAWRSSDDGESWTPLDNGLTAAMVSGFVFPGPTNEVICSIAWGANSIRTSQTNGDAWMALSPGPGDETYCLSQNAQGDLFTGSEGSGVKRFNSASQTWTHLGLDGSQQFSIAFNSQGHVFVGNDGNLKGVYKSVANGDGLIPLNSFPGNFGYAIACLPNDDLYVGTRAMGIQYSGNGGNSWTTVNSGIPVNACQGLALGVDGHLYAGVAGFGVYRSTVPVAPSVAGDIDNDGDVDDDDILSFVGILLGADSTPIRVFRSDIDGSGIADSGDIAGMSNALTGS